MTKQVKIFDTTLRDGEQSPGCSMNFQEKLELARQLEKLKVDVIEAGFAISSPGDFAAIKNIAQIVKNSTVASLARALPKDIDSAWNAVKYAQSPRIHTFIATSDIHMQYKLRMTPEKVLERAKDMVAYARNYCDNVEFSAEDSTRSKPEFLYKVVEEVINAGATVVNIADTVGYTTPFEFYEFISGIKNNVPNIDKAEISVHCHNDLGLAVANTLASLNAGATQFECTVNGLGERAGNAALEELVMALYTRKDVYDVNCNIDTTQIYRSSKLVTALTGVHVQPNKAIVGENAFAHEAGIHQHGVLANKQTYEIMTPAAIGLSESKMVLGKHSGRHAFEDRLKSLEYDLSKEKLAEAFENFKVLADKKKVVTDRDLEALVQQQAVDIPQTFQMKRFVINSGNTITTTAAVTIINNGEEDEAVATGDGPVDAALRAIDLLVGVDYELEDYAINAVTKGTDAQGEVTVRIRNNGKFFTGRGLSTDIVEASVQAYITAINKLVNEQEFNREGETVDK